MRGVTEADTDGDGVRVGQDARKKRRLTGGDGLSA